VLVSPSTTSFLSAALALHLHKRIPNCAFSLSTLLNPLPLLFTSFLTTVLLRLRCLLFDFLPFCFRFRFLSSPLTVLVELKNLTNKLRRFAFHCFHLSATGTFRFSCLFTSFRPLVRLALLVAELTADAYPPCSLQGVSRLSTWKVHLEAGFPLRCFQRLSLPNVAIQPYLADNWHTSGSSIPVLSY
jgi:hypothetical protein